MDDTFADNEDIKSLNKTTDAENEITLGRKIARILSRKTWYNPSAEKCRVDSTDNGDDAPPNLDKAWEYYERFILPRCFVQTSQKERGGKYVRAESGETENSTRLYPVWETPQEDMGDFGIGVGLYFSTLQFFAVVCFLAGCINIPNIVYLASDMYSNENVEQYRITEYISSLFLRGSAICTTYSWQLCPTCDKSDFQSFPSTDDRLAFVEQDNGTTLTFIKKHSCEVNDIFGALTLATLIVIIVSTLYFIHLQREKIEDFDEAEQTATDYSIQIKNPPIHVRDPDVWKQFFQENFDAQVVVCTVALNNEKLIEALVKRKQLLRQLQDLIPYDVTFDEKNLESMVNECPTVPLWKNVLCCGGTSGDDIYSSIQKLDEEIEELTSIHYNVTNVFVTFETEHEQRRVLDALNAPLLRPDMVDERHKFNGVILQVSQPDEPSSIRWFDLYKSRKERILRRIATSIMSIILIAGGVAVVTLCRRESAVYASLSITFLNIITPMIVSVLVSLESHPNHSSFSASQYIKVTAFRWINTAVVTQVITPFTDTLQNGDFLIKFVYTQLMFDLFQGPLLRLTDIYGNLCKHILAPRAPDQRRMNLYFSGGAYDIGERYTNVTRVLFLTFWYSAIFPMAFFFASAILTLSYWLDKFSILRSWKQGPRIGHRVSKFSIDFFLLCIIVISVMSSYNYAQFPFDNACSTGQIVGNEYETGTYNGTTASGVDATIFLSAGNSEIHKFCNQNLFRTGSFPSFPSDTTREWMNSDQETYTTYNAWACLIVVVLVGLGVTVRKFHQIFGSLFFKISQVSGDAMDDRFSEVKEIFGYIPQMKVNGFQYPFLLCNIKGLNDKDLIGWDKETDASYDSQNLVNDVQPDMVSVDESLFTIVKDWAVEKEVKDLFD